MRLSLFLVLIVAAACCEGCRPLVMIPPDDLNAEFGDTNFSPAQISDNGMRAECNNGGLLYFKSAKEGKILSARHVVCSGSWTAEYRYTLEKNVKEVACSN